MLVIEDLGEATVERWCTGSSRARRGPPGAAGVAGRIRHCRRLRGRAPAPARQRPSRPGRDRQRAHGRSHDRDRAPAPRGRPVGPPAGRRLRRRPGPRRSDRGPRRHIRGPGVAADRQRCTALLPCPHRAAPPTRSAIEPRVRTQQRLWRPARRGAAPLLSRRRADRRGRAPGYRRTPRAGRDTAPLRGTDVRTSPRSAPRRPGRRAPRLARGRRRPPSRHP